MALRPPDRGSFEHLLTESKVDATTLIRLSKFPATEPYFSVGRYRFDGPPVGTASSFGTCYVAPGLDTAFAESVIHECSWFRKGRYEVPQADLESRHIVRLERPSAPVLVLADLTSSRLKRLGLNNDISAGDDYIVPMAWAKAIYEADAKWDGIQYVSRQRNDAIAVALFDRSGIRKRSSRKLEGRLLDSLCDQFQLVVV